MKKLKRKRRIEMVARTKGVSFSHMETKFLIFAAVESNINIRKETLRTSCTRRNHFRTNFSLLLSLHKSRKGLVISYLRRSSGLDVKLPGKTPWQASHLSSEASTEDFESDTSTPRLCLFGFVTLPWYLVIVK